jgi:hypothetical protein
MGGQNPPAIDATVTARGGTSNQHLPTKAPGRLPIQVKAEAAGALAEEQRIAETGYTAFAE